MDALLDLAVTVSELHQYFPAPYTCLPKLSGAATIKMSYYICYLLIYTLVATIN